MRVRVEFPARADERQRFRMLFQDGRLIVSVRDLPDPDQDISEDESELFGIIDGQRTVNDVIAAAACDPGPRCVESAP